MNRSLLWHQARKSLGLSSREAQSSLPDDPAALARALRQATPASLTSLLEEVASAYLEADASRRRLSHALRMSSSELSASNLELARQARGLELLHSAVLVAQRETEETVIFQYCAEAMLQFTGFDTADIRLIRANGNTQTAEYIGSRVRRTSEGLEPTERASGDGSTAPTWGADGPAWADFAAGVSGDGAVSGFAFPIGLARRALAIVELRSHEQQAADPRITALAKDLGRQIGQTLERRRGEGERDRLGEQLRQAQKMEAIGKLAGGVAHDFNNLLTAIFGYGELVRGGLGRDHPLYDPVGQILCVAERARDLTHQLLAFSRKQVLAPKSFDLNTVVASMSGMLARLIGENIHCQCETGKDLPWLLADPGQMGQVLLNLVVNARDAMPTGGHLTITTGIEVIGEGGNPAWPTVPAGSWVTLAVADTGTGMSDDTQMRIFEPFFTTKQSPHGTGLGLSTVYGIITQSGGHIVVDSEVGRGTTFRLFLPVANVSSEAEAVPAARGGRRCSHETVLLVEDDANIRSLLVNTLRGEGYAVLEAGTMQDALTLFRHYTAAIHILVADVVLPDGSGIDLAVQVRERHPATPLLFISGYAPTSPPSDPNTRFLAKPFLPSALANAVRDLLDETHPELEFELELATQ